MGEAMGHRNGGPTKRALDFQVAAHEHFGYEFDALNPIISLRCATTWLHTVVGAEYDEVKRGVFVDGHGKDHVQAQRKRFLTWYFEVYDRGPNFVRINDQMVDKDKVKNLHTSELLKAAACIGPRSVNLGGAPKPSEAAALLSFVPAHIDHVGKVWITVCHDECCVHTNEGETYCWKIPGIEMGDCPPKHKGDIMYLADANAEIESGTYSLDGGLGMISRKELRNYIKKKLAGEAVNVPTHYTVWMHAGGSGEGY